MSDVNDGATGARQGGGPRAPRGGAVGVWVGRRALLILGVLLVAGAVTSALLTAGWPTLTDGVRLEYQWSFDRLQYDTGRIEEIQRQVDRIIAHRAKYEIVERVTDVPWYVVGVIDTLEAGGGASAHLHNGDPLTARTVHVPAGRPDDGEPPFSWYWSALDALEESGWTSVEDKTIPSLLYHLEAYNGWGYFTRGEPSPYLYAGSDHYTRGKYVRDGVYDPNAVSRQIGAAVLLRALVDRGEIQPARWKPTEGR